MTLQQPEAGANARTDGKETMSSDLLSRSDASDPGNLPDSPPDSLNRTTETAGHSGKVPASESGAVSAANTDAKSPATSSTDTPSDPNLDPSSSSGVNLADFEDAPQLASAGQTALVTATQGETPLSTLGQEPTANHKQPMIEISEVYKIYPRRGQDDLRALDGISLKIQPGEIHGIVGQSGAGKSTLIRCLTALETPSSGSIKVAGQDLSRLDAKRLREARRSIGMVFQSANLLDSRTAAGNIAYPLYLAGEKRGTRHQQVERLLELVGLKNRGSSYPSQLSGGQQQRVGIARALADNPQVLLCDEPTSALDSESTQQILHLIRDVHDRLGVTVVIITHEMSVVREICTAATLLESGKIVQSGTLEQILLNPASRLAKDLVPPPNVKGAVYLQGEVATLVDIAFTSTPGNPTGAKVMDLVAKGGADVVAGTFETVGTTQVGRLALAVKPADLVSFQRTLASHSIFSEVRS